MICKKCNTEIPKGNKVCTNCGATVKKPIYKKIWFWILLVIIIGGIGNMGANNSSTQSTSSTTQPENTEASSVVKKEEKVEETVVEEVKEEYVNTAEEVELFSGDFTVGTDLKAGRYTITATDGSGNFFVYDGELPVINEILSTSSGDSLGLGITKMETDLKDGQTIKISGINNVKLSPATIELKTTLSSGTFTVGRDIPEGSYIATTTNGSGNLVISGSKGIPKTNEILGKDEFGLAVEKVKVNLSNGDIIHISGLDTVNFS